MPSAPLRPCLHGGCGALVRLGRGRCDRHHQPEWRSRPDLRRLYYSTLWRKFRSVYLAEHVLCADCQRAGRVRAAKDIHHIVSRRDGGDDFDEAGLEALCHSCHSRKGL